MSKLLETIYKHKGNKVKELIKAEIDINAINIAYRRSISEINKFTKKETIRDILEQKYLLSKAVYSSANQLLNSLAINTV